MYQQAGEQTFLLESRGDANHKLLDDDRFVLTECRLNCIGAPTRSSLKQTTWARRLMWRHEALHLFRAQAFCKRKETRECVLTHNNKLWVVQDRSQHVVSDGDYLMVEAFTDDVSIREARNCLERMEQHECSIRRMYTVAPDGLSQPGCASEREKATNSGSRGESYGGQALGNAEEALRTWKP